MDTKNIRITELKEKIAQLLVEPDIGYMDWELGKCILANWKANLPEQILALISGIVGINKEVKLNGRNESC